MTIGRRIKQRRMRLGYTLDELKDLIKKEGHTLSKASLSKYELDKSVPKADNLWYLAKALQTSPDYFLRTSNFEIHWIAFRKKTKLSKREEDMIRAFAKEQIEARLFLTEILGNERIKPDLPGIHIRDVEKAENAAEQMRNAWNLSTWPIESVTGLLEKKGVFVMEVDNIDNFDGLSGYTDNSLPVIITSNNIPIDRKRLNITHELAHLVLNTTDINEEHAAFRFAAAFLMPGESLKNSIGAKRVNIDIRELILLKEEFGISVQALIRRCYDLNIISSYVYKNMNIKLRVRGLHIDEPGQCFHKETPALIKSKLIRAIAEGNTTESEVFSRFPSISMDLKDESIIKNWLYKDRQEKNNLLSSAAERLDKEYNPHGHLSGLDLYDEIRDYNESSEG